MLSRRQMVRLVDTFVLFAFFILLALYLLFGEKTAANLD